MPGMLEELMLQFAPESVYASSAADEARKAAALRLAAGTRRAPPPVGPVPNLGMLGSAGMADWGATPETAMSPPGMLHEVAPLPVSGPDMGDWGATPQAMGQQTTQTGPLASIDPTSEADIFAAPMPPQSAEEPPAARVPTVVPETEVGARSRNTAATNAANAAFPAAKTGFDGFLERLNDNRGTLMALAGGFLDAPSVGAGASRAFKAAAPVAMQERELAKKVGGQRETYEALRARGVPPQEAIAATKNPELMKAIVSKYFETKAPTVINGKAYLQQPDGQWKEVINNAETKAPQTIEVGAPGGRGTVKLQWDADANKWTSIPGYDTPAGKVREMTVADVEKLSAEGSKLNQVRGFNSSFNEKYAGYKVGLLGDAANTAGRNLPVGKDLKDQADWWQSYQAYKNVVRNQLFGSALTPGEQTEFEKGDISPGMAPDIIKRNLARQQELIETGMRRKAAALEEAGFEKAAVQRAYGLSGGGVPQQTTRSGVTKSGLKWGVE